MPQANSSYLQLMGISMPAKMIRTLLNTMLVVTAPALAQSPSPGTLPEGWTVRPDQGGSPGEIRFAPMEPGFHLTTGPAAILYRAEDKANGPFHTLVTLHQTKKPRHPEGYGLFVGGQNLTGKNQTYTYFLVRGDGTYLIKQRKGDTTAEISKGWTSHPAVKKENAEGKTTNLLEVDAKRDPQKLEFKVNGQTVYSAESKRFDVSGIVGIRANHNLDLHFEGFAVHQ